MDCDVVEGTAPLHEADDKKITVSVTSDSGCTARTRDNQNSVPLPYILAFQRKASTGSMRQQQLIEGNMR